MIRAIRRFHRSLHSYHSVSIVGDIPSLEDVIQFISCESKRSVESLLFWSAPNNYLLRCKFPPSSLHNRCSSKAQVNTNTTILALQSMQSTLTYSDDPTPHESPSISYSAVLPIGRAFRVLRLAASSSSDYISPCIGICKKEVHVSSTKVVEQRHNHEPAQHK